MELGTSKLIHVQTIFYHKGVAMSRAEDSFSSAIQMLDEMAGKLERTAELEDSLQELRERLLSMGPVLRQLRGDRSQTELAREAGCAQGRVSELEAGLVM